MQASAQLLPAYCATIVFVEVGKGLSQVIFLKVVVTLKTGGYEFGVVNQAILVAVNHLHSAFQICKIYFYFLAIFKSFDELINSQLPISVLVNLSEALTQEYYLVFRDARCHVRKSCALKLD